MTSTFTDSMRNSWLSLGNNNEAKLRVRNSRDYISKDPQTEESRDPGSYRSPVLQPLESSGSQAPHLYKENAGLTQFLALFQL